MKKFKEKNTTLFPTSLTQTNTFLIKFKLFSPHVKIISTKHFFNEIFFLIQIFF